MFEYDDFKIAFQQEIWGGGGISFLGEKKPPTVVFELADLGSRR